MESLAGTFTRAGFFITIVLWCDMNRKPPLVPGTLMGCYTVVGLLDDAIRGRDRVYTVRTRCCNREMTRNADAIFKSNLRGSEQCSYCATGQAVKVPVPIKTSLMQPGAVVGPVTIIAEDEVVGWRLVRWSCCGKEELMRVTRLYTMRHRRKAGRATPVPGLYRSGPTGYPWQGR